MGGKPVGPKDIRWDTNAPVYTDGTAVHTLYPVAAVAASAAVQLSSDSIIKHMVYLFDHTMPRTAVAAEHIALILVMLHADQPVTVVTGCQAVHNLATD